MSDYIVLDGVPTIKVDGRDAYIQSVSRARPHGKKWKKKRWAVYYIFADNGQFGYFYIPRWKILYYKLKKVKIKYIKY